MFSVPPWLGAGAVAGVLVGLVTTCWQKIKSIFWRIVSYAIVQIEIKDDQTGNAVLTYLIDNYKLSKVYDRTYGSTYEYTREDGKYGLCAYEFLGNKSLIFWNGWKPLFFSSTGGNQQQGNKPQNTWQPNAPTQPQSKTLTYIRGTFNADVIIQRSCDFRNNLSWNTDKTSKKKRFFIKRIPKPANKDNQIGSSHSAGTNVAWYHEGFCRLLKYKPWELGKAQIGDKKALDCLIFPDRIKRLIREVQIWRVSRDWYNERSLPWKRGWILYGPPGTGKSILVRAFAEDEDMPLFSFSLGEMSNSELQKSWEEMQAHVPCIALFEDIDNVFHGRKNIAGEGKPLQLPPLQQTTNGSLSTQSQDTILKYGMLSFDCLLNCIDGIEKSDGVFTIFTTNNINKIDPALGQPRTLPDGTVEFISSRPGRVDKAIELTYMECNDKLLMAERILKEYPEGLQQMVSFLEKYPTLQETPAQFQERCAQLALSYFWIEKSEHEGLIGVDSIGEIHRKVLSIEGFNNCSPKVEKFIDTSAINETSNCPGEAILFYNGEP